MFAGIHSTEEGNRLVSRIPCVRSYLYKFVYSRDGHPEDVDDMVQDTLLWAMEHYDGGLEEKEFTGWLLTVAKYTAKTHITGRWRQQGKHWSLDDLEHTLSRQLGYQGHQEKQAELRQVLEKLDMLPEEQRELIIASCEDELNLEQLGEKYKVSHKTANKRIKAARDSLRSMLNETAPAEPKKKAARLHDFKAIPSAEFLKKRKQELLPSILKLFDDGLTVYQIAQQTGQPARTIGSWLKVERGWQGTPKQRDEDTKTSVMDFVNSGGSLAEAARKFNVGRSTVIRWTRQ